MTFQSINNNVGGHLPPYKCENRWSEQIRPKLYFLSYMQNTICRGRKINSAHRPECTTSTLNLADGSIMLLAPYIHEMLNIDMNLLEEEDP